MIPKLKTFRNIGFALFIAFTFNACLDDSEPDFEMVGDVYVIKKIVDNEIKYAPAYFAYGNVGMSSASVALPDGGGSLQLNGVSKSVTYYKEPTESDFSSTYPAEGTYVFNATSYKDVEYESSDILESDDLEIPQIDSVGFTAGDQALYIGWDEVSGAEGYFIKLLDSNGVTIFNSYSIASGETDYIIIPGASGQWDDSPETNEVYTILLHTYTFDADANQTNNAYNIQDVSIGESEVTWQ